MGYMGYIRDYIGLEVEGLGLEAYLSTRSM